MAQSFCPVCNSSPARVAVCAYRFIGYRCGRCGLETAQRLIAGGERVSIDPLVPRQPNDWTCTDGSFFDRDADARAHQKVLDARAISFAHRLGRIVAELQLQARRAA